MRIIRALVCVLYVTVIAAATASAQQDVGDARAGQELAAERCASCHAIGPDTSESPVERATR